MKKKKIAVIGTGIGGLHISYALAQHEAFEVSIYTHRTIEEIRNGAILSTQVHFHPLRNRETRYQIPNFAEGYQYPIKHLSVTIGGQKLFIGTLPEEAVCIDQRLYVTTLLEELQRRGIAVTFGRVQREDLPELAKSFDLIIDATGKTGPVAPFPVNSQLSPIEKPQRICNAAILTGLRPDDAYTVSPQFIPAQGELFEMTMLTSQGYTQALLIEAIPGGDLDLIKPTKDPERFIQQLKDMLQKFFPSIYDRIDHDKFGLFDPSSYTQLAITPKVHVPYTMVNQTLVIGCGDSVVLNDPVTGQGANTTSYCSEQLFLTLAEEVDAEWNVTIGENYWNRIKDYVTRVTEWSNGMLGPLPDSFVGEIMAGAQNQTKADEFASFFANPLKAHSTFFQKDHTLS